MCFLVYTSKEWIHLTTLTIKRQRRCQCNLIVSQLEQIMGIDEMVHQVIKYSTCTENFIRKPSSAFVSSSTTCKRLWRFNKSTLIRTKSHWQLQIKSLQTSRKAQLNLLLSLTSGRDRKLIIPKEDQPTKATMEKERYIRVNVKSFLLSAEFHPWHLIWILKD